MEAIILDMRKATAEYRLGYWAQIMQERKDSGMSVKDYCELNGMHPNKYFYWQRKLRETALAATGLNEITGAPMQSKKDGEYSTQTSLAGQDMRDLSQKCVPTPAGWTLCEPNKPASIQSALQIEIGACRIAVYNDTDYELLAKIVRTLTPLC